LVLKTKKKLSTEKSWKMQMEFIEE
jgi:hypothetical protein